MNEKAGTNALARETSPYLLQHAHNPVQWYPWGEEALERAREEDKPILLSIGYSACHWCHVMAHESFENQDIAALMNRHFINIKVDREERPDLDKIYQTAQQLLTHRTGGWPLTMFLTPGDQMPFFGGTYFPPEPRHGMPGFPQVLERVAEYFRRERTAIHTQNLTMAEALASMAAPPPGPADREHHPLESAVNDLAQMFDERSGGFGGAPKFPHPPHLDLLLAVADSPRLCGDPGPLDDMTRLTLERMAAGGIHDQLCGGFARYAVDDRWMIPHFEKMLYDNGQLLCNYVDGAVRFRAPGLRATAEGIAGWVMAEMQGPDGGYYSSLDADSEGHEGRFYVWDREAVRALLAPEELAVVEPRFGFDQPPNFEGRWHLHVAADLDAVAHRSGIPAVDAMAVLASGMEKLRAARALRVRPGTDDKILASWNGLMIRGMARAALRLGRDDFGESAARALSFVRESLWREDRLLATHRAGISHLDGYLDDYAMLLDATLALLEWRWSDDWLSFARELAAALLRRFEDEVHGGFFFTSHTHEPLIQRRKDFMDDAIPSGNAVAMRALMNLGHLLGDEGLIGAAERCERAGAASVQRIPSAHCALLAAMLDGMDPPLQVILRGPRPVLSDWQRAVAPALPLRAHLYAIPDDVGPLPGLLAERRPGPGTVAYLCEGFTCEAPITDIESLSARLATPGR